MPRFDYRAPTFDYRRPDMSRLRLPSRMAPDVQEFWDELLRGYDQQGAPPAAPPTSSQIEPPPLDQTAHETPLPPARRFDDPLAELAPPGDLPWQPYTSYARRKWVDDAPDQGAPPSGQRREVPPVAPTSPSDVTIKPPVDDVTVGSQRRPLSVLVDGKHYVVPGISDEDGHELSVPEAIAQLKRTGEHFGVYGTTEESERAAEALRGGGALPPSAQPPLSAPSTDQPQEPKSALDEYTDELLRRPPNYAASTLSRITPEVSQGEEPDFYGYDDERGFDMDERARRATESYQQKAPSTRWEDEFLARHLRPEDAAIQRRSMGLELFAGAERAEKFRKEMYDKQSAFDKGQAEARGRDRAESQIDPNLAEAIAATGLMSPEAAGRLTNSSPVVQAFVAGGYNVGPRRAQQELERDKLRYGMLDKYAAGEQRERGELVQGAQRQETARLMAEGQKVTEEERQGAMRGAIMMAYGIPKDVATQVVATYGQDMKGVPPQYQTQVQSILEVGNVARNRTDLRTLMGMVAQLAKGPAQTEQRVAATYATAPVRESNIKEEANIKGTIRSTLAALKAWQKLSPAEKQAYVSLDRTKPMAEQLQTLALRGQQVNIGRLEAVNNLFSRMNSGLTLTPSEMANAAREQGLTTQGWLNLGKDPAAYEDFLRRTAGFFARRLQDRRKLMRRPTDATRR